MLKKLWLMAGVIFGSIFPFAITAMAAEQKAAGLPTEVKKYLVLAVGLGMGIASAGGAIGQGRGMASAMEGIARNPSVYGKLVTAMLIGLAMIESLVIYTLVIELLLFFKL